MPADSDPMIDAETADLSTHVQMCRLRHQVIEKRLTRIEWSQWAIIAILLGGGVVTIEKLVPIARALAGH